MDLEREQTPAVKRDWAGAIFLMKGDLDVCSAEVDLCERQISRIAPVLKGRAEGLPDLRPHHVRCVVVDAVGESLLPPTT